LKYVSNIKIIIVGVGIMYNFRDKKKQKSSNDFF